MKNQKIISNLIREDLRNKFLINAFRELMFDFQPFSLNIQNSIIELSGSRNNKKEILDWYSQISNKALEEITCWNQDEMLDIWTQKICEGLSR